MGTADKLAKVAMVSGVIWLWKSTGPAALTSSPPVVPVRTAGAPECCWPLAGCTAWEQGAN